MSSESGYTVCMSSLVDNFTDEGIHVLLDACVLNPPPPLLSVPSYTGALYELVHCTCTDRSKVAEHVRLLHCAASEREREILMNGISGPGLTRGIAEYRRYTQSTHRTSQIRRWAGGLEPDL